MCGCSSLPGKCCCTSGGSAGALCECSNLEIEEKIMHEGNVCTYIGFDTDKITIDACGPNIVLDDNQLTDKIVHTGQSKFINDINDVPNIYVQDSMIHSGDANTSVRFPANDQIALRTGGVDRVFVDTTGNVGIATTTPAYLLDVNGSAKVTTIRDTANSVGTAGQLLSSTGSALQWVAAPTTSPAAPVNSIQFNNAGAFGGDSDFTFDSSTNTVRVNGKTVVGSTSSNALEVFSNGDTEIGFSYATVGNNYGKIIGDVVSASPLEGEIAFQTALSGTLAERMRINKSGNVGIATPTPAYPLDVNGSAKFTTIRDSANSVGTSGQVLSSTGTALSWVAAGGGSLPCAVVRETKTANTNSAVTWTAGTTGNLQKRQFNVVANSGMSVTVSGSPNWTFTIPSAGTYFFEARATIRTPSSDGQTVYGKLVLNNNTLGLGSVIVGDSHTLGAISTSILQNTNWTHHLSGFYTITGSTVFTLDHIIASQNFAPIGGLASNLLGYDEVYSVVNITKIA